MVRTPFLSNLLELQPSFLARDALIRIRVLKLLEFFVIFFVGSSFAGFLTIAVAKSTQIEYL